jgi:hypothetical protein
VTIVIGGGTVNHSQDMIAIRQSMGEALKHDHAATLAPHKSIGSGIKGLAPAIDGHHVGF